MLLQLTTHNPQLEQNKYLQIDFGFWKVNTSTCVINEGKLSITGLTGTPPYTYLWNDGQTGQTITGLTVGIYSCTVTDGDGCVVTKSDAIGEADPLGVGIVTSVNPSCFSSDGSITFTITGGSVPYYYSASTSQVGYTLSNTLTLSGLSSGNYNLEITDANFCKQIISAFINAENSFFIVDTVVTNSNCSQQLGSLTVSLQGSNNFYSYILSGQTNGLVYTNTTQSLTSTFSGLTNDTYDLIISATGTNCEYTTTVTLASTDKFEISATTTGSTCSQNDGVLQVQVGTGYTSPLDYILSDGQSILDTSLSSYTFNNLVAGSYTLTVVDADGCQIDERVTISTGGSLISAISTTQCYGGQNGTAEVLIYDGEPTFSYDWSDNVPSGQTGSTISGLTAGTYSVEVTDSSGCSQTHNFTITCSGNNVTTYSVVELCQNEFATTVGDKRGFLEMLNEGYIDVTSGYTTGCAYAPAQYYSDPTETYTITLRDSMGNPITTPRNLYFGISWTSTEVQETGTIITPNSTTFFVPAGTSSTFQLFTINQTVNCDYSGACNGSCYNAISDITITPPEGLPLCEV